MRLNNITIRSKLVLSALLPIIGLLLIVVTALAQLKSANEAVDRIYKDRVVPLEDLKIIADDYAVHVIDAVNKANAGLMTAKEALAGIRAARAEIGQKWQAYMQTTLTDKEAALAKEAQQLFVAANAAIDRVEAGLATMGNGRVKGQLDDFDGALYADIDPISAKISELVALQLRVAGRERQWIAEQSEAEKVLLLTASAIVIAILIGSGLLVYSSVRGPLNRLQATMEQIATHSDLSLSAEVEGADELSHMARSFNQMLDKVRNLLQEITAATGRLATAAGQMTQVSQQATSSISAQRMEIEQVAAAMNEMVSTVQAVAVHAEKADGEARRTSEQARQGNVVVGEAARATQELVAEVAKVSEQIRALDADSESIGSIVDVIKGIADQTNLLALNAAIEAARAGEQGRGFAVVADEVRSLAQRTQLSTQEIQNAIQSLQTGSNQAVAAMEGSRVRAEAAGSRATEAGVALGEIAAAVHVITDMNTQIASASEEQSSVADEINRSLVAINDAAHDSTAGADQIARASRELAALAEQLQLVVAQFRV